MRDFIIGITAGMVAGIAVATNPKFKCMMEKAKAKMNCRCQDNCDCNETPSPCCDEMNID
ncbi:MAG: hypothetical protein IKC64_05875 [Clostridia bacterium]|nr:hypothetical protein [Clostridia bacterium]